MLSRSSTGWKGHHASNIINPADPPWAPFLALLQIREMEPQRCRLGLLSLLEHFRFAESKLPHDRFFSLLGPAVDSDKDYFEINYEADFTPVAQAYARAFVKEQGLSLELLHQAGCTQ
jgi:hypothetical protein